MKQKPSRSGETVALTTQADFDAFRLLVDSTTDYAIFMLDPDGYIRTWSAGAARIKGYSAEEVIGKHFSIFYPPDALVRNWPAHELDVAARVGRIEDEGWRLRKDGTRFWANVVITALRDETGTLVGFGKVSRDMTQRRRAEQQLQESEERFRLMIEGTLDYAIFMLDPKGHVASWNPGAERMKGYKATEIIGRHFSTFYTVDAIASRWPDYELTEAARVGRFEDEGWRVRKDGTRFWANVIITALRGADGTLRGFSKVTRDISERRAHEQNIERLKEELELRVVELATTNRELVQKSSENESFVYGVSHDLRSPLVNLQGFSHELRRTSESLQALLARPDVSADLRREATALLTGEFEESLGFIRNAVQHLGNIIDGLLRLSRVGRVVYQAAPIDMNALVADMLAAMHNTIAEANAQIDVESLPAVLGDRNAVGQVFANIIGNALKSFDRNRPGHIRIWASDEEVPVFAISDNGVGIPVADQSKIFQIFQPVQSEVARGEGMGLAIVRRIIERHGGRVWFDSRPDEGTTFFFTIGRTVGRPAGAPDETHD